MSDIEPKKLKVAELREELKARGLESKGNKAQLVKRLEKHLANESGVSEADVSVEGDAEEAQEEQPAGGAAVPEPVQTEEPVVAEHELEPEAEPEQVEPKTEPEPVQQEPEPVKVEDQSELVKDEPNSEEAAQHEPMEDEPVAAEIKSDEHETVKKEPVDNGVAEEVKAEENEGEGGEDVDLSQEEFQVMDQVGGDDDDKKDDDRRDKRHHSSDRKRSRSPRDRDRHYKRRSRTPPPVVMDSDDWLESTEVELDRFNSDLNLRIEENGTKANPITVEGFAFMWGGARSSYGVTKGKVGFEVKVLEHLNVRHLPPEETSRHVLRVGFSTDATSLQLGEEPLSYGYGGTAKASTDCKFKDYGEKFGEGDVVGAYLDLDADPVTISYTKNGEDQGVCYEIERATLGDNALFPHVLTKNSEFEVNFGKKEEPFFPTKEEYTLIAQIPLEDRVRGTLPPAKKEDCEMIMMCGLPGAGKTYWAAKYAAENPEKRYFTLGTNNIIDKMKVMGLPRKKKKVPTATLR